MNAPQTPKPRTLKKTISLAHVNCDHKTKKQLRRIHNEALPEIQPGSVPSPKKYLTKKRTSLKQKIVFKTEQGPDYALSSDSGSSNGSLVRY